MTHRVVVECFVFSSFSCVLSRLMWIKSDELCCGGHGFYDIFSLVLPNPTPPPHPFSSSSTSAVSFSTFNNMIKHLSPTGKSAWRGAEKESWRTCMKLTHLQSVQIKFTHALTRIKILS